MKLEDILSDEIHSIESYLRDCFKAANGFDYKGYLKLYESINYSLLSGGKRFRPTLSLLTAQVLNTSPEKILPYASAVEFIHTYSLIHDDLPLMDDDDLRRGKPTNHKVYGEDIALLAGDALLTAAFEIIAENYKDQPDSAVKAILALSKAAGKDGMVGGQSVDIIVPEASRTKPELEFLHRKKTGALIAVAIEGAAILSTNDEGQIDALTDFGQTLGLAFQLADDVLDYNPDNLEPTSFATSFGIDETKNWLNELTEQSLKLLEEFGDRAEKFKAITLFNKNRTV